jgi:hypothetical protein
MPEIVKRNFGFTLIFRPGRTSRWRYFPRHSNRCAPRLALLPPAGNATADEKIIKNKVGQMKLAEMLRQRLEGLRDSGAASIASTGIIRSQF